MKICKPSECRCENRFMQECFCKKCDDAERRAWELLAMESLRKVWDNPKDEAMSQWYMEKCGKCTEKLKKKHKIRELIAYPNRDIWEDKNEDNVWVKYLREGRK